MVSTDTRCCGCYMGHRSVALTWSSVVDDRPDGPSRTGRRHRRNVWCECSSKSIHCSKVHSSHHPHTIGLGSFTRRPVWTRRASHPAPSGRPPRGGAKVTWFGYSCEYLGYSREDSSCLITQGSTTHTHTALRAARTARARTAPPPVAEPPNSRHHARTTTHDDEKDAACPHGHKAGDADRWGTATLGVRHGVRSGNGNGVAALFLPCERGSHRHTVVITRPRLSLAL